ncbi:hypothetical protein GOODEAATRI_005776, partial [Goodea atripinnis]
MLYLRMCLAHSAGATPMSTRLLDMQDDAPAIGRYVHTLLSAEPQPSVPKGLEANPVHVYMDLLQQLVSAVGGIPVMYCLLEVVSVCPEKLAPRFADKIDWIKSLMNTNKEDMRELAAQLYALVISTMTGNELQTAVQNLVKITKDNHVCHSPETQHGAILALGYMVGRNLSRKKVMASCESTQNKGEEMSITSQDDDKLVSMATKTIGSFLDSSSAMLTVAACTALGEIGRNGSLLIPAEGEGFTKLSIVENLLARITSGKESIKVDCLTLLLTFQAKQVELQFTVGEAITSAAIGTCSGAARDPWTCTEDQYSPPHTFGFHMIAAKAGEQLAPFLPQLVPRLYRYQFDPNLSIRQAMTSIWDALVTDKTLVRVKTLLEALSTLEPQVLNYLSLRATEQEKVNIFQLA